MTTPQRTRRPAGSPSALTEGERELLIALTLKCRFMSVQQAARHWWPGGPSGERSARRALRGLSDAGWLEAREVTARPLLPLAQPVACWHPGDPAPDCGALSWQLQSRWKEPLRAVTVVTATRAAAFRFGGFARGVPLPDQATHDLHVAAIYLQLLGSDPTAAATWQSEEVLRDFRRRQARRSRAEDPPRQQKLPDAVLVDAEGTIQMVVEFGGAYDAPRVEKLHVYCADLGLPYQLW